MYPKIYLAIDNCVFYKRWTSPDAWARKIRELGLRYVEASADTELDPLYMGQTYLYDWVKQVRAAEAAYDIKVANLYSGHGSYTTLGLAHPDACVRRNLIDNWFFPLLRVAAELDAGTGFFAHAFAHEVLQSEAEYRRFTDILVDSLSEINAYGAALGCKALSVEQMYTPHQYPWRLKDTRELLQRVTRQSGHDFYFTEDLGHHHIKFVRPDMPALRHRPGSELWLGSDRAYALWKADGPAAWNEISADMDQHPSLFSTPADGDCYRTLRTLGCYSPIIHLQQTNGRISAHLPFTPSENEHGIITPEKVLRALKEAYEAPEAPDMPQRCTEIYLTLELFSGTTSIMDEVMLDLEQSVHYWREAIPRDGMPLDDLVHQ